MFKIESLSRSVTRIALLNMSLYFSYSDLVVVTYGGRVWALLIDDARSHSTKRHIANILAGKEIQALLKGDVTKGWVRWKRPEFFDNLLIPFDEVIGDLLEDDVVRSS